ncbi:unnamed protein product, partial [Chrysoparadoxa australica]
MWEQLDGGPCPAGHYCPLGTDDPVMCPNSTVRVELLGTDPSDCGDCSAGYVCHPGEEVPQPCPRGYYCRQGELPAACSPSTHNPDLGAVDMDGCVSCPAGYFCSEAGTGDYTQYPCPAGHYCLTRQEVAPNPCPGGTLRSSNMATSLTDCEECPEGHYCAEASTAAIICPMGTYCPAGSLSATTCPEGFYCPVESAAPLLCPANYFCPLGSSEPTPCFLGAICEEGSSTYTYCPEGSIGQLSANNSYSSVAEACDSCPPGTFSDDPGLVDCKACTAGYTCLGGTITPTPLSEEDDRGYICPVGHYCPEGSSEPTPCPSGTYNPTTGGEDIDSCLPCNADFYQAETGYSSCLPCSASSTAMEGSSACTCKGLNRAFQASDGLCICDSGYEYWDETGQLVSDKDGTVDCQPIVFDRCAAGEILNAFGNCASDSDCSAQC